MPYIAFNATSTFDSTNAIRYPTQEEADARARDILMQSPSAHVFTAQVLNDYTAKVSISVKDPAEPSAEIDAPAP